MLNSQFDVPPVAEDGEMQRRDFVLLLVLVSMRCDAFAVVDLWLKGAD